MSPEAEAYLQSLERAVASRDDVAARRVLDETQVLQVYNLRTGATSFWDRFVPAMAALLDRDEESVRDSAFHWVGVSLWVEQGGRRFATIGPLLTRAVARDASLLLKFVQDHSKYVEDAPEIANWIEAQRPTVPAEVLEAARLIHTGNASDADTALVALLEGLNAAGVLTRASAARGLGELYVDESDLDPPLHELVQQLKGMEIARPGVAGPFLAAFYHGNLEDLAERGAIDVKAWMFEILEQRLSEEPNMLPVSNGIDFYAHEMFDSPDEIKRLIACGELAIAEEAASDANLELEPLLLAMNDHPNVMTQRKITMHLAMRYGKIAPQAEERGFLRRRQLEGDVEAWLVGFDSDMVMHAAVVQRLEGDLSDTEAHAVLDRLLPESVRGAKTRDFPWDYPQYAHFADTLGYMMRGFEGGASANFIGDNRTRRWAKLVITWHAPVSLWNPSL